MNMGYKDRIATLSVPGIWLELYRK